jgi:hypothetical protein
MFREGVSSAEVYVGPEEWSGGMRNTRGRTRYQAEGCGVLWNRLATATVCTLVREFILVAFLISVGHIFFMSPIVVLV